MTEAPTMHLSSITASAGTMDVGIIEPLLAASTTSSLRTAIVTRSMIHLYTALEAGEVLEGSEFAVVDDRLRRREQLLHQLALERSRRRRRSA